MTPATVTSRVDSPIGPLLLIGRGGALVGVHMHKQRHMPAPDAAWPSDDRALAGVADQLRAYFAGDLKEFDVDIVFDGTPFQCRVWGALRDIPYGETVSYGTLAAAVGRRGAARAVGAAVGRNPVSIIVPCHRVVGADGSLTGFGGGLDRKQFLLGLESGRR
ncbi:MAG TPA: methylated-DNA--[protein]-cysteine S-methyltransferase [Acidimicrobiales bacterium]|nr:methylated-DNA--[protein]-cysteine S-methyltransferase [Acidimicrobiales bacterium]